MNATKEFNKAIREMFDELKREKEPCDQCNKYDFLIEFQDRYYCKQCYKDNIKVNKQMFKEYEEEQKVTNLAF